MNNTKQKAFTLVELIVVVTILAILATIGFVSYSSYLTGVRDTNRISQLSSISDGLNLYSTKNSLPLPEDSVEVQTNTQIIAYQGYAGSNTLETIDFTKGGIDPKDDSYFSYYVTKDRKHFQLMAFLEEADSLAFVPSPGMGGLGRGITHAADYSDRYPTVTGRKLGILTDESNSPIQEVVTDELNITASTTGYIAYLTNDDTVTGESLLSINPKASCKRIKQMKGSSQDGVYEINPTGAEDAEFEVYCDMTTDGGGWTALIRINPSINDYDYWEINLGKNVGDYYNYMNKSSSFTVSDIYVSKGVGWDGSEFVFENIDGNLYTKRGTLKGLVVKDGWTGLATSLERWTNAYQGGKVINSESYTYFMYTDISLNDFPFYTASNSENSVALSDEPWGYRGFLEDVDTYIFVR